MTRAIFRPAASKRTSHSAQALTESAKLAKHCLLVVSLPASETGASPHTQADGINGAVVVRIGGLEALLHEDEIFVFVECPIVVGVSVLELLPAQTALKLVDRKRTISVLIEPVEESRRRGLDLREIKRSVVVGIEALDGALGPCGARLGPSRRRRQGSSRDCEESTSTAKNNSTGLGHEAIPAASAIRTRFRVRGQRTRRLDVAVAE